METRRLLACYKIPLLHYGAQGSPDTLSKDTFTTAVILHHITHERARVSAAVSGALK